jgi:predicted Zn finger-like uncharacterized protein
MRIICPSCDATYEVPDAMLAGAARKVRCARCGNEWVPTPVSIAPLALEESEADFAAHEPHAPPHAEPPLPPEPPGRAEPRLHPLRPRHEVARGPEPPDDDDDDDEPPRPGGLRVVLAWSLSLLVLAGLAVAAVQWRGQVMAAWPPSERLYVALGLR